MSDIRPVCSKKGMEAENKELLLLQSVTIVDVPELETHKICFRCRSRVESYGQSIPQLGCCSKDTDAENEELLLLKSVTIVDVPELETHKICFRCRSRVESYGQSIPQLGCCSKDTDAENEELLLLKSVTIVDAPELETHKICFRCRSKVEAYGQSIPQLGCCSKFTAR